MEIDFTPPFKRIDMMKGLEEKLNVKFPEDLDSEEAKKMLDDLCVKHEVLCPAPRSPARMIDKVLQNSIFNFYFFFFLFR